MENLEGRTRHLKEHCTSVEEAPRGGGIYYPVKVLSKKVPILRRALRNFAEWLAPTDDLNKANELRERIIEKYNLGAKDVVFYGVECSGGRFGKPQEEELKIKMAYYDVRAIIEKGKRIGSITSTKHLPHFTLGENEVLVGIVEDASHAIAPDLTDSSELNLWHKDYSQGIWMNIELYKLTKDELLNCPDRGAVPIAEVKALRKQQTI